MAKVARVVNTGRGRRCQNTKGRFIKCPANLSGLGKRKGKKEKGKKEKSKKK